LNKVKALKVVNIILFIAILWVATTGIGHDFIDHELFEKIHPAGGGLLILMVIIHVILNWGWIKASYFKKSLAT